MLLLNGAGVDNLQLNLQDLLSPDHDVLQPFITNISKMMVSTRNGSYQGPCLDQQAH